MRLIEYGLTPVVCNRRQMEWVADAAERRGLKEPFAVHVEIDTGMSRQGTAPGQEFEELLQWLAGESRLRLDGVMTVCCRGIGGLGADCRPAAAV